MDPCACKDGQVRNGSRSAQHCELHECTLDGARGLTTLKGVSMRWVDIVELAPLLAGAFGVHVIDET